MERSLTSSNAVVIANAFNPSVVRESFLVTQGILPPDAILPGFVFSEQLVTVSTSRFSLLVLPQQLQFVPTVRDDAPEVVLSVVPQIIGALPHTPYVAAGINFVWQLKPSDETVQQATRRLFAGHAAVLADAFKAPDARFGFFASKDLGDVRMKVDVKPVHILVADAPRQESIQCSFNFHVDLGQDSAALTVSMLCGRWCEFDALSEELAGRIAQGITT